MERTLLGPDVGCAVTISSVSDVMSHHLQALMNGRSV